jgi:hypothetical protein
MDATRVDFWTKDHAAIEIEDRRWSLDIAAYYRRRLVSFKGMCIADRSFPVGGGASAPLRGPGRWRERKRPGELLFADTGNRLPCAQTW